MKEMEKLVREREEQGRRRKGNGQKSIKRKGD